MALKLSKQMRDGIVRAIMSDLPRIDIEQIARDEVLAAAVSRLPEKVRAVWNDQKLRDFLDMRSIGTNCGAIYCRVPGNSREYQPASAIIGEDAWIKFQARCGELRQRNEATAQTERSLRASLAEVATAEQFCERFPGLAKYAPVAPEKAANLPATTSLIDSLREAGLPALTLAGAL